MREGTLALMRGTFTKLPLKSQVLATPVEDICDWSGRYLGLEWQVEEVTS